MNLNQEKKMDSFDGKTLQESLGRWKRFDFVVSAGVIMQLVAVKLVEVDQNRHKKLEGVYLQALPWSTTKEDETIKGMMTTWQNNTSTNNFSLVNVFLFSQKLLLALLKMMIQKDSTDFFWSPDSNIFNNAYYCKNIFKYNFGFNKYIRPQGRLFRNVYH